MAIGFGVYNADQQKVFVGNVGIGEFGLKDLCGNAPEDFLLRNVHPYGDTMFNGHQLQRLLEEIDTMATAGHRSDDEVLTLTRLHEVAAVALRRGGYLWFFGD